jgi:hypothetical protein
MRDNRLTYDRQRGRLTNIVMIDRESYILMTDRQRGRQTNIVMTDRLWQTDRYTGGHNNRLMSERQTGGHTNTLMIDI